MAEVEDRKEEKGGRLQEKKDGERHFTTIPRPEGSWQNGREGRQSGKRKKGEMNRNPLKRRHCPDLGGRRRSED